MNDREMLLRKLSAVQFAAWELHIYLDTHKKDMRAAASLEKYNEEVKKLRKIFEDKYGPITPANAIDNMTFKWTNDPWPWERQAN